MLFRSHFDPSLPPLEVDAEQLMQVLQNLLKNAAEAIGEQAGTIRISTGIAVGLASGPPERRRSMVRLSVRDSGPGFDPRVLAEPFTPFLTTKSDGTGLGLAMVRRLIEAHGGLVELASAGSGGAEVRLFLPV